jgi:DNA-binding LytR/AlgR family response regulator
MTCRINVGEIYGVETSRGFVRLHLVSGRALETQNLGCPF